MASRVNTGLSESPLNVAEIHAAAQVPTCGAIALFHGTVRDNLDGTRIAALHYSAHPHAESILQSIAEGIVQRQGVHHIEAWHRVGALAPGEIIMVVAVAAEHRSQAFSAVEALVEEVKTRLPVWKRQELANGRSVWPGLDI